ncbi:MAG: hypothetical protein PWQ47_612 [Methanothermococcus sp.]|jgi:hypothetical protein|nr:hypothetical protein [Methanothermococcus thermolithotrophicus]MDK2987474.1 hypothetical protein [Methanothermococcus sp.]
MYEYRSSEDIRIRSERNFDKNDVLIENALKVFKVDKYDLLKFS